MTGGDARYNHLIPQFGYRPVSVLIVSRTDFQQMADERLSEAKLLLDAGKWSGAYYLAGYAV